ncbi:testis-expressed protein 36 [Thunnus albacares]|uniref:testis-expressed protein 36 n=1 Tax=Thunnus maccoyii TaxID=8240 RepID=UPI001C4CEB55|nr:testis-expressed protein 36 [Thunnus maccoyii]XP_044229280.1 testis-expressed protein 36 [Thunnus albacares]
MVKGGKRYFSMSNDCKWFAHPDLPRNETRNRETCTSTGLMLTQVKSSLPQALNFERYPKWKTQQKSREYPFSDHDNKRAFKDNITVFTQGVGRRKCLDDYRQHNSHFCLCHDGADGSAEDTRTDLAAYRTDFMVEQAVNVPTNTRRFPRNHKRKSEEAALAQAGEQFMWFGRHDSHLSETLEVLAATNCPASSNTPTLKH